MLNVLMLYATIAVLTALAGCALRRAWYWELFTAESIIAGVGAWTGAVLIGSPFGPTISGIPVCACLLFAVPFAALFNLAFVPATLAEPIAEEAEPASAPPLDTNLLNLPQAETQQTLADVA